MDASSTASMVSTFTANIVAVLQENLPTILLVVGGLFALLLIIRLAKRLIGGR